MPVMNTSLVQCRNPLTRTEVVGGRDLRREVVRTDEVQRTQPSECP